LNNLNYINLINLLINNLFNKNKLKIRVNN
jgi:hypothetical protein